MGFIKKLIEFVLLRVIGYAIILALIIGGFALFVKIMMAKYGI